jgi:hypothetical protein
VIGTGPDELLLAAAELCPTTAIRIVDQPNRPTGIPLASIRRYRRGSDRDSIAKVWVTG